MEHAMYELKQLGERSFYIDCPSKIGLYLMKEHQVCLIDSGNDKDAGKKVLKLLEAQGWKLDRILCTHSHADHIGGCAVLQQRTGCSIYCRGIDQSLAAYPLLEPSFLYGGFPPKALRNKFLMAQESQVQQLTPECLPGGLQMTELDGHSFSMTGFYTSDQVWFLGDCVTSANILEKYAVSFLYDPKAYLDTLDKLCRLKGRWFLPAHGEPAEDICSLAEQNRAKVLEILSLLLETCSTACSSEQLLQTVLNRYGLTMDWNQQVLVGSTIRSYLSYLLDQGMLEADFSDNMLTWKKRSPQEK